MYKLSTLVLFTTFILMTGLFAILFFPINVLTTNRQPYKVLTPKIKVGGVLIYQVDACKHLAVPSTVTRTFTDGVSYPAIIGSNNIKIGCSKTNIAVHVPSYIPIGQYHLELDVVYKINALRDVEYNFETESFNVIK